MKYLEDEKLNQLTSELTDASLGDSRVINGRIEAFIMKRAGTDKKYAHALGERYVAEMELAENQLATYQQLQEHLQQHAAGRKRSQSAEGYWKRCIIHLASYSARKKLAFNQLEEYLNRSIK
jgi:hypothetical protein